MSYVYFKTICHQLIRFYVQVMTNPLNELVHRYITLSMSDYTISWFIIGMGDIVRQKISLAGVEIST
jgi:hypothetical protein